MRIKTYVEFIWDSNSLKAFEQSFSNIKEFSEFVCQATSDIIEESIRDKQFGSMLKAKILDEDQEK